MTPNNDPHHLQRRPISILPSGARIAWVAATLILGLAPSAAFFAWIERNASLPWAALQLDWPWITLSTWPAWAQTLFNAALLLVFGAIHSLLAQLKARQLLGKLLPIQAVRATYIIITGMTLLAVMGLWQNTGVIVWVAPLPWVWLNAISLTLYGGLMAAAVWILSRMGPLSFVGIEQIYSSSGELKQAAPGGKLMTSGLYSRMRHPAYAFTLLALYLTPFMTLDRLTIAVTLTAYLWVAIPIEERKLITEFGSAYLEYRSRVPALFPSARPPRA
jgi:protein-S-isoprenylcysteine O-methyltransferase Ste14